MLFIRRWTGFKLVGNKSATLQRRGAGAFCHERTTMEELLRPLQTLSYRGKTPSCSSGGWIKKWHLETEMTKSKPSGNDNRKHDFVISICLVIIIAWQSFNRLRLRPYNNNWSWDTPSIVSVNPKSSQLSSVMTCTWRIWFLRDFNKSTHSSFRTGAGAVFHLIGQSHGNCNQEGRRGLTINTSRPPTTADKLKTTFIVPPTAIMWSYSCSGIGWQIENEDEFHCIRSDFIGRMQKNPYFIVTFTILSMLSNESLELLLQNLHPHDVTHSRTRCSSHCAGAALCPVPSQSQASVYCAEGTRLWPVSM